LMRSFLLLAGWVMTCCCISGERQKNEQKKVEHTSTRVESGESRFRSRNFVLYTSFIHVYTCNHYSIKIVIPSPVLLEGLVSSAIVSVQPSIRTRELSALLPQIQCDISNPLLKIVHDENHTLTLCRCSPYFDQLNAEPRQTSIDALDPFLWPGMHGIDMPSAPLTPLTSHTHPSHFLAQTGPKWLLPPLLLRSLLSILIPMSHHSRLNTQTRLPSREMDRTRLLPQSKSLLPLPYKHPFLH